MKIASLSHLLMAILLCVYSISIHAGIEEDLQQLFNQRDYQAALDLIEAELEQDGTNKKWLLARGFSLVKLGRLDLAVAQYKNLESDFVDSPEPGNNLAIIYSLQGNYAQAIEQLNQTIEAFPDYARAYENLGDTYVKIAQHEYQRGLDKTGEAIFKKKVRLSQNFNQIAAKLAAPQLFNQDTAQTGLNQARSPVDQSLSSEMMSAHQAIFETLNAWRNDWMSRDFNRYLSHYAQQFTPENDLTLEQWMDRKERIISSSGYIKISLSEIDVKVAQHTATTWFTQKYESDGKVIISAKLIKLRKIEDDWLIIEERSEDK